MPFTQEPFGASATSVMSFKSKGPARMFLREGGKKEVHSIESQKSSQRNRMQDYHIYTAQPIVCTLCNHVSGPSSVEPTDNKTQNLLRSLHSIELRGTGP